MYWILYLQCFILVDGLLLSFCEPCLQLLLFSFLSLFLVLWIEDPLVHSVLLAFIIQNFHSSCIGLIYLLKRFDSFVMLYCLMYFTHLINLNITKSTWKLILENRSHQYASKEDSMTVVTSFLLILCPETWFGARSPKRGFIAQSPTLLKTLDFFILTEACHQYASNEASMTVVALFLLILCPETWFGARTPKSGPIPQLFDFWGLHSTAYLPVLGDFTE